MTYRIKEVIPRDDFIILAIFQDGVEKEYDVKTLFDKYPQFIKLKSDRNLFGNMIVDVGGCGVVWNDELDLAAEEIWFNGINTGNKYEMDIFAQLGVNIAKARTNIGITQKELAETVHIYQGDISKIERGNANPSVQTLQRLAEGLGMKLKIEFVPLDKKLY